MDIYIVMYDGYDGDFIIAIYLTLEEAAEKLIKKGVGHVIHRWNIPSEDVAEVLELEDIMKLIDANILSLKVKKQITT